MPLCLRFGELLPTDISVVTFDLLWLEKQLSLSLRIRIEFYCSVRLFTFLVSGEPTFGGLASFKIEAICDGSTRFFKADFIFAVRL